MKVLIINGWGQARSIWQSFLDSWEWAASTEVLDLDKFQSLDEWLEEIDSRMSDDMLLIGWSLGGLLALKYAERTREASSKKLRGLVTLQCNPCFVQRETWPYGVNPEIFDSFAELIESGELELVRKKFSFLMVQGSEKERVDLRILRSSYFQGGAPELLSGLALLSELDGSSALSNLSMPNLHIFGGSDALVPLEVAERVQILSPNSEIMTIEAMGHLPVHSYAESVQEAIYEFISKLADETCLSNRNSEGSGIEKTGVRNVQR